MPLFKSNSILLAFDNSYRNEELSSQFSFVNFLQELSFKINAERINQKSIGSSVILNKIYTQPQVDFDISYYQKIDFFNERLFGFFINADLSQGNTFLEKLKDNFKNNGAVILLNEKQGEDIFYKIKNNGYTNDIVAMSIGQIYLNNYSFSFSVGSAPIARASFTANELKVSNIQNQSFLDWQNINRTLTEKAIIDYEAFTNRGLKRNVVLQINDFSYTTQGFESLNFPSIDFSSFVESTIQSIDFSFDFQRNKFFFFENGMSSTDRYFLLPLLGNIQVAGIMQNINKKTLDSIVSSDNKFSMTLSLGLDDENKNKTLLNFSNIEINSFDYSVSINGFIQYTLNMTFQVNETNGFKISSYYPSPLPTLPGPAPAPAPDPGDDLGQFITIKSSDGHTIMVMDQGLQKQVVALN